MTPPKETNKGLVTDPKEIKIHELSEYSRIMLLKKFSELQKHTDRQLSEMFNIMHGQNKKFKKEIETIKIKLKRKETEI